MERFRKLLLIFVVLMVYLPAKAQDATPATMPHDAQRLILATTTSTQDSGLLDYILPAFEEEYGVTVDVIAVGTGQALQLGRNGDADVLLVHSRAQEDEFLEQGFGAFRYDVMYNDFIVVGPDSDPAGIRGITDATAAFQKIADTKSLFVSRGDDSGTYAKELAIWKQADIPLEEDWYISAGQGMGEVLNMATEFQAYTLSDRATYVTMQDNLALVILVEGDKLLFNPYGVIMVNPEKHPQVNAELGQKFAEWLISVPTQKLIAGYQVNGQQLFTPDSELWKAAQAETTPEAEMTPEAPLPS